MGRDGLKVGVEIRKYFIISTRIFYRSVRSHPSFVGIFLFLLFLYRSSPFLFSLLVSASPILVCTAVLLGTLLSFGEPIVPLIEEDEIISAEIVQLKTGRFENTTVVEEEEGFSADRYAELRDEVVERSIGKESLLDNTDRVSKFETDDDVACSSMMTDHNAREIRFGKQLIDETSIEFENLEVEQKVNSNDQKTLAGDAVGLNHDEVLENRLSGKTQSKNFEDYKSTEDSVDFQTSDELESSLGSWKRFDEVFEDRISPVQKVQAAVHAQIRNQLESSLRSWKQLGEVVGDKFSPAQRVQMENFEDYKSAEGSIDTQIRDQLESSLGSWKQFDSDHDGDDESDYGSDGAESSSPDASLADIIPMLDELHPLLEDENPHTSNLSRQSSAATTATSGKSQGSSIHSDDGSDEKEEEAGDIKSDADDDDEEEEGTQGSRKDHAKSAIRWTKDDQKNLMDLGTSELERNQRLESLIARRRARKNLMMMTERNLMTMMTERNLIDLEGMDLQFQVAPISTTRHNPFDLPHDSYDGLGLPPIPGSAPSVLAPRRNPFDLPYDSSEEKPDLMGDSFQQEFMELNQREASFQKESVLRRNETFNIGSSTFDFGKRASRFRPYFVPERTDSDLMSYSSLQRQHSGLSESKLSSAAETESVSAYEDEEAKKPIEHESAQEMEPCSEVDEASLYVEHGSQSSEDVHLLSDKENEHEGVVFHEPVIELVGEGNAPAAATHISETGMSAEIPLMNESIEEKGTTTSSSLSLLKEYNDVVAEDLDEGLLSGVQRHVNDVGNADVSAENSLQTSVSEIPAENSLQASDLSHVTEPVYDLSPQAVKKNHSSSSMLSDLHMETSEIDSCHFSAVQRDLFVGEKSKDQEEDAEQNYLDEKQNTIDNALIAKHSVEANGQGISEFQFSEVNQHPIPLEPSVVPEYKVHLSMDSSDTRLVEDELFVDKFFNQEDDAGVHMEDKMDAVKSEDDTPFPAEFKPSEDNILGLEEGDNSTLADCLSPVQSQLSYAEVEPREESTLQQEADEQFLASSHGLKNDDNDIDGTLVSLLDEAHYVPHDSAIRDPCVESEQQDAQEPSIFCMKLEEVVDAKKVDETVNMVLFQQSQDIVLLDQLRSNDLSSQPHESEEKPVADLADKEDVHNDISQELGVSGFDEKILVDLTSDFKDRNEDLLSELDAVGDFSVKDTAPILNANISYSNAEFDSSIAQLVPGEVYSSIGMPSAHDMLPEGNTSAQSFEAVREITEPNNTRLEESNLDSHTGDTDTCLLVLEAQSVEDIDAAFKKVREGEVQNSIIAESVQAELTREQVEAPYQELFREDTEHEVYATEEVSLKDESVLKVQHSVIAESESVRAELTREQVEAPYQEEFFREDTEHGIYATEEVSLKDDSALINRESVAGRIESDLASVEVHNRDYNERQAESGMSILDAEISEQVDEDFKKYVQTETEMFNIIETEVDTLESAPLQIDRDIKETDESSFIEESIPSAFETSAQVERFEFVGSEALEMDEEEIKEAAVVQASIDQVVESEHQTERINFVESEPLNIDGEINEMPISSVVKAALAVEIEDQGVRVGCVESESLLIGRDIKEIQELPVDEADLAPSVDSEDETKRVGSLQTKSLLIHGDIEEIQEARVAEAIIAPSVDSKDESQRDGSLESESLLIQGDIKEIQESRVPEAIIARSVDSKDETQRDGSLESESLQIHGDIKETQESPVVEGDIAQPIVDSDDQTKRDGSVESQSSLIDRDIGEIQESHGEAGIVRAMESEDQAEGVDPVESEIDAEIKEIQESHIASEVESKGQVEVSPHMEVTEVQAVLQDSRLLSSKLMVQLK